MITQKSKWIWGRPGGRCNLKITICVESVVHQSTQRRKNDWFSCAYPSACTCPGTAHFPLGGPCNSEHPYWYRRKTLQPERVGQERLYCLERRSRLSTQSVTRWHTLPDTVPIRGTYCPARDNSAGKDRLHLRT